MFANSLRLPFFIALLLLPLLSASLLLWTRASEVALLEQQFATLLRTARRDLLEQLAHQKRLARYRNINPYYLNQEVESLAFCTREIATLQQLLAHPAVPHKQFCSSRLALLTGEANRLRFLEESRTLRNHMVEEVERQQHPILLHPTELQPLLFRLEGHAPQAPQLIVTQFHLRQTPTESFEITLNLLKRTFE